MTAIKNNDVSPEDAKAWQRRPGEPVRAYRGLKLYIELGEGRSLNEVAARLAGTNRAPNEPRPRAGGRIKEWCRTWDWVERAAAYDARMDEVRREAAERAEQARADAWVRRRDELIERDWTDGRALREQACLLTKLPVVVKRVADGGKTVVVEPAPPATIRAAALALRDASELEWRAVNTALGREEEKRAAGKESEAIRSDELDEAAAGLDAWVAAKVAEIAAIPLTPPTGPEAAGEERL